MSLIPKQLMQIFQSNLIVWLLMYKVKINKKWIMLKIHLAVIIDTNLKLLNKLNFKHLKEMLNKTE